MADYPALDLEFLPAPGPDAFLRDRVSALLDDYEPTAIQEEDNGTVWRVFFRSNGQRDAASAHLAAAVAPHLLRTRPLEVRGEDWARRSQQGLRAIEVGGLIVAPPWDIPTASVPVIVIEPSTGFGTGHHPTTRLCLRLLQRIDVRGARVLDVGTGSGILALAAWKGGAAEVIAVDSDLDALDNARANVVRNGAAASIRVLHDDLGRLDMTPVDVLLANLTGPVLVRHADGLTRLVRPRGYVIMSGFGADHLTAFAVAFPDFQELADLEEGDWHGVLLQNGDNRYF